MKPQTEPTHNVFADARAYFEETIVACENLAQLAGTDFTSMEQTLRTRGLEQSRLLLQGVADSVSDRFYAPDLLGADGIMRSRHRVSSRQILSTLGQITFSRMGFFAPGAPALFLLDGTLNLPEGSKSSHELQKFVAREAARGSYDSACETLESLLGVSPGKRQSEQISLGAVIDFDDYYENKTTDHLENGEALLVMSTDAKGVVVRTEDLREPTRERALENQAKLSKRLSSGEKANRKRMAQVATCYDISPFKRTPDDVVDELAHQISEQRRPRPQQKRVWANLVDSADKVIKDLFEEAKRRNPKGERTRIILIDGQRAQRQSIERLIEESGVKTTIIIDFIHVIEYFWGIVWLFFSEGNRKGQEWITERLRMLLQGKSKEVCRQLRRFAGLRKLEANSASRVENVAQYLETLEPYLRYDLYIAKGYPISTGVIEGACRHLVKDRMDITGARWSLEGAEAVLRLRSLISSEDFEGYWKYHLEQEFQQNHATRYADPGMLRRTGLQAV